MRESPRLVLPSTLIPQADRLERVGEFVLLTAIGALEIRDAVFVGRDFRYYASAAQLLDLLDDHDEPTLSGQSLAQRPAEAKRALAAAFLTSSVGRAWAEWAGEDLAAVLPESAGRFLRERSELAASTAERRAQTLAAWLETCHEGLERSAAQILPADPSWTTLQSRFPAGLRDLAVAAIDPPTRVLTFCKREQVENIGALLGRSEVELLEARGMGAGTVRGLRSALTRFAIQRWTSGEEGSDDPLHSETADTEPIAHDSLADALSAELESLPDRDAEVLTRRLGIGVPPETLAAVGTRLDVSRERIRQLESRAWNTLRAREAIGPQLADAFELAVGGRRYALLSELTADWLGDFLEEPKLVATLVERLLEGRWMLLPWGDEQVLYRHGAADPEETFASAEAWMNAQSTPFEVSGLDFKLAALCPANRDLTDLVKARLFTRWAVVEPDSPDDPRMVVGRGDGRGVRILEHLIASPEPVAVTEIAEKFGRGSLPEQVAYVRRGWVTLPDHLAGFDQWAERLAPPIRAYVEAEGPERQWMTAHLLEYAHGIARLPKWITPMLLVALLERSGEFVSLGRQRLALAGHGDEKRVELLPGLAEILEREGAPLPEAELASRMRERVQMLETTFRLLVVSPPMLRLTDGRIGLIERDTPGGVEALDAASEYLERKISNRGQRLPFAQALAEVQALGGDHAMWGLPHVRAAARRSPGLLVGRGSVRAVGAIDDAPESLAEDPADELAEDPAVADAQPATPQEHRVEPHPVAPVHEPPPAAAPESSAVQPERQPPAPRLPAGDIPPAPRAGSPSTSAPPPDFPTARSLSLPRSARDLFGRLTLEAPGDWDLLSRRIQRHAAEFSAATRSSEFLPIEDANALGEKLPQLFARARNEDPTAQRLAWVAGRYFEISDDGTHDFAIGGLDDDVAVFNAVARAIGAAQLEIEQA